MGKSIKIDFSISLDFIHRPMERIKPVWRAFYTHQLVVE